jgi:PAT family beta-lactamase induction signal transducer AmpG
MNNVSMILQKYCPIKEISTDLRIAFVFLFGIVSGMPVSILYTTLAAWMMDKNFGLVAIGMFALSRSPYAFKFLWAKIVDDYDFPGLSFLGRRRSWMVASNIGLVISFLLIQFSCNQFFCAFLLAIIFGFCAATFDIAYEAYRIEILDKKFHAIGIATSVFGYRMGLLVTGVGSLYLASIYSWNISFYYTALFLLLGTFAALLCKEPERFQKQPVSDFYSPFKDILSIPNASLVIATIATYRVGEAMLGTMLIPFFLDIGFSKGEIATYAKIFGLIATLIGAYLGGVLVTRYGYAKTLLICGIPQMLSNLGFIFLNHTVHNISFLTLAVIMEDLTAGMGTTAIVAFLCSLCDRQNTATKFAVLSAIGAFANNTIPFISGEIAALYGWDIFFIVSTIVALPGVIFAYIMSYRT